MQTENLYAFKEWAVICAALEQGKQSIILRKGGIHEGRDGFRVEHSEFWLFPTSFHQTADSVVPEAGRLLEKVRSDDPVDGMIRIRSYARVEEVFELHEERQATLLAGHHYLSEKTVLERFNYRRPGLVVLLARIYLAPEPMLIMNSEHLAGCKSWVDLPGALPTEGLAPAITDREFAAEAKTIRELLAPVV